jgi:Uma2 family endonuclease
MTTTQYRFTSADLERMPDDGKRYEVIDGELYVTHAPHSDHQATISEIEFGFRGWDPGRERGWALAGAGVIFSFDNDVIPDLVWLSAEQFATVLISPKTGQRDGKLHAAPNIAVEVLSPGPQNEERDRETKLALYSRRGVREYWIVDRLARTIEVYRRTEAAVLALVLTLTVGDTLTSPLLPGFALPVEHIFRLPGQLPQ